MNAASTFFLLHHCIPDCMMFGLQEALLTQSQWKDYVSQPPPYAHYTHDGFEQDDPKGWGPASRHHTYERQMRANTHSLPRGSHGASHQHHPPQAYPMGYSSYDRRSGGFSARPSEFPPDHYFMPSQRKYSGEVVRVYVDYNK